MMARDDGAVRRVFGAIHTSSTAAARLIGRLVIGDPGQHVGKLALRIDVLSLVAVPASS
jgi:hypothetical protein